MTTYTETAYRFQILAHDDLPEGHKAEYRAAGIDPDNIWTLIYSFQDLENAEATMALEREDAPSWRTFKLVDAGATQTFQRSAW